MNLNKIGWNSNFADEYKKIESNWKGEQIYPARIAVVYQNIYQLFTKQGVMPGQISGKMRFQEQFPVIGDWVAVRMINQNSEAIIERIIPRKSKFSRQAAGSKLKEQIIVANLDFVFIVSSLNQDFNLRRLERYLTIAWDSGASPVIVLTKADISNNISEMVSQVEDIAFGVNIHVVSSFTGKGLSELGQYFKAGRTIALLGSSGVGKSTLINKLVPNANLRVNNIREDDAKGRHTTTNREMISLPEGGVIIDTPGMREIQLWQDNNDQSSVFPKITKLAQACKFNDCQHDSEPGCMVKKAIEAGRLSEDRLESYRKLARELKYMEIKAERGANAVEKYKMFEVMQVEDKSYRIY